MDFQKESLKKHYEWKGKLNFAAKVSLDNKNDLSLAYTPGVAEPCLEINKDIDKSYDLTMRGNLVAVITDGSAVLGLGNIGAEAAMPVMEGKCALFKKFGGIDAVPICIKSNDVDTIVNTIHMISGSFGGINLEDISAPRCFEIERRLKEVCDIPIFHDDQHGTAVVVLAGLINALSVADKKPQQCKVVFNGAGAAATAIIKLLNEYGFQDIVVCDRDGVISKRRENLNKAKTELAEITNHKNLDGSLEDVIIGADVFIGTSAPNTVSKEMVSSMNNKAIVFACANPTPEIFPEQAKSAGAYIVATGRSDYPNQVNNLLAFPGIFRGAFNVRAKDINEDMKMAAAKAIASVIKNPNPDCIIPSPFDKNVAKAVAKAVAEAAIKSKIANYLKL